MTAQLRDLIGSLEHRVATRTERLETVASLTEYLTGILDFELERSILFWWNFTADYRGSGNGFHGPDSVSPDVESV